MPLLPELARRMVLGLDEDKSFGDLYKIFQEMVNQKLQNSDGKLRKALEKLQENDKECLCLFHAISRPVLRSLLMGRLAMDFWRSESSALNPVNNRHHTYDPQGPGTYALAVYVRGRQGKWLSTLEIQGLVRVLREYDRAWKLYDTQLDRDASYTDRRLTTQERALMTRAMNIDNHLQSVEFELTEPGSASQTSSIQTRRGAGYHIDDYERPRFAPSDADSITDLCDMLRRRCRAFDATVQQESAPVQIGCTNDLHKRLPAHNPRTSSLVASSKNLGLLVSAMAEVGCDPGVVAVPILRVWEYEQLALSEIMVHVLAGSFIDERGLNKHHPGVPTRAEEKMKAKVYEDCQIHVWLESPWWTENMKYTRDKMIQHHQAVFKEKARELKVEEMLAEANEYLSFDIHKVLEANEKSFNQLLERWQKLRERAAALEEEAKERDRLIEELAEYTEYEELMKFDLFGLEDEDTA